MHRTQTFSVSTLQAGYCILNQITRIIKREKSIFFKGKFESTSGDAAGTWKMINSLIGRKNTKSSPPELMYDNKVFSTPVDVANCFNSYFTGIASKLECEIPLSNVDISEFMGERMSASFFVCPVSTSDVKAVIGGLRNKSNGLNSVPIFIYKSCAEVLSETIVRLFNISVSSGIFPLCLKLARVVPIYKAGGTSSPGNYRPISTLSVLSKIFEMLMYRQLVAFLISNSILSTCQFGFRKNCSTSDAVLEFVDYANNALDQKMSMVTVFLDFSKAFDTVKHSILIRKLEHVGIRGVANDWFNSYVSDRKQFVDVDGVRSDMLEIGSGVPQGSILGPVLFLLYINDMNRCSNRLKFIHFADDTTVFCSGQDINTLIDEVNEELVNICTWLYANRLSLNVDKTSFMITSDKNLHNITNMYINNVNIKIVTEAKFLGIIIDSCLTFRAHVGSVCRKMSKSIGILNRISSVVPPIAKKCIYFSLVYPYITYGIAVWGGRGISNNRRVERLMRRATKIVSYPQPIYHGITQYFFNFESVYKFFTLVKMFRVMKLEQHSYFRGNIDVLVPQHEHHTRFRQRGSLRPPQYSKTKCQKTFFFTSIGLWNDLPSEIRSCNTLGEFRKFLKAELIMTQNATLV